MIQLRDLLEDFLGVPAFVTLGVLIWWQQKELHALTPNLLLAVDRALSLKDLPPLAGYALLGGSVAVTLALLSADGKLLDGPLRWRGLVIPVLAGVVYWVWLKP